MDQSQRGRSPSAAGGTSAHHSRSPSAQNGFNQQANARGLDPTLQQQTSFAGTDFTRPGLPSHMSSDTSQHQQFLQPQDNSQQLGQFANQQPDFSGLDASDSSFNFDPSLLDMSNPANYNYNTSTAEDNLSPHSVDFSTLQPTSMPANMGSFQQDSFASYNTNAIMGQNQQSPDVDSRHQSLSPSSAALQFNQAGGEWAGMGPNFQGHRRNQSDAYSDISSHHSPFIDAPESFDINGTSPLSNGQPDPTDQLSMGTFNLSETMAHQQRISPGHSQHASPRISPQLDGPGLLVNDGLGLYPANGQMPEQFPGMNQQSGDFDTSQHLEAPEINIQFAPERQLSFNESGQSGQDHDALSPPMRGSNRPRGRAISDPYSANVSRSSTPNRNRAPSLGLHPHARSISRSSSPGGPANGVHKPRDRASSTGAVPAHRDKIVGLADPLHYDRLDGMPSGSSNSAETGLKRTQKHPATFQCTLCPKRFTRAYNLRSHLRTHTDERPFVCSVCGKAFARQHDRKRHEGLHSGEKKFVCKGLLAGGTGSTWGCGRRFARADALGRHFRSEAGRACIKPLLDEEARERRAAMMEQHSQEMMNSAGMSQANLMPTAPPGMPMPGMGMAEQVDVSTIALPAALLAQYPALAGIQWDTLPAGGPEPGQDDDDFGFDHSGRSSFDAGSSGGEHDFEDDAFSGNEDVWNSGGQGLTDLQQQQGLQGAGTWNGGYSGS